MASFLHSLRARLVAVTSASLVLGLAGCGTSSETTGVITGPTTGTTNPTTGPAHVRLVQAVRDASNGVDVAVNDTTALRGLRFAEFYPFFQGQYQNIGAGSKIGVTAVGATSPFFSQSPSAIAANAYVTLVFYGRSAANAAPAATVVALGDTNANAPTGVLLRLFNAVDYVTAGTGTAVDVYIYPQGSARPATPDVAALAYGARSAYLVKGSGTLTVDVFAARAASTGTPLFTGTVSAAAGGIRTAVLVDPPAGSTGAGSVLALFDYN